MYRQYFTGFFTLSALVGLPTFVLSVILGRLTPLVEDLRPGPTFAMLGVVILMGCWYAIMEAALCIATSDRYLGREIEPARALREALSRSGTLMPAKLWTWFVLFWAFFPGILFIVTPFYFFARYFAIPQALLFERLGVGRGLDRTRQLAKGEKWKILKSLGLIYLIFLVISMGVGLTLSPEPGASPSILAQLFSSILSITIYPLIPITATLLYYDVRIRREGFDIEFMSAGLERATPVAGAAQG
jgi:polyferredoxin